MRYRLLSVIAAAALAVLTLPSAAQADHSWGGYHWARTANQFTLQLGDNVTSTWDSHLQTASADWTQSSVLNTTVVAGQINDTYFNQAQYNTPAWRRLVMCQEIAHTFGPDHQDENFNNPNLGTCMDCTSDPDGPPSNEHPNAHDFDQLVSIYSPLDSFASVGQALPGSQAQVGDSPASWGRLVSGSGAHGHATYVRDLGHGEMIVTFVIWA